MAVGAWRVRKGEGGDERSNIRELGGQVVGGTAEPLLVHVGHDGTEAVAIEELEGLER